MMEQRLFLFPVRRRLFVVAAAWLCGIYAAQYAVIPARPGLILCALLVFAAMLCCRQHRSALLYAAIAALAASNLYTGAMLAVRDEPTAYGVHIEGVVYAVESEKRVVLGSATADGVPFKRRIVVTLMTEEGELREPVMAGQRIGGTGRLFAQDEVRNPGAVDQRIRALVKGYELSGYILPGWTAEGKAAFSVGEWVRAVRRSLLGAIERVFGEHAPFFQGVMLGEDEEIDAKLIAAMRLTGVVHILTVSGLHMSVLAAALAGLLDRAGLSRWIGFLLEAVCLSFFALLTGAAAGTCRALIMALYRSMGKRLGLPNDSLTSLALSALVITVFSPLTALTASFQFSFFIVLGIVLLSLNAQPYLRLLQQKPLLQRILNAAWIGFAAQLSAVPVNLVFSGYLPVLGLPMNLLCGMFVTAVILCGWVILPVGLLAPQIGSACAALAGAGVAWFERLCLHAGSMPFAIIRLPAPHALSMALLIAAALLISRRIRWGRSRAAAAAAMAAAFLLTYMPRFDAAPRYVQLDVGQGDCALLRSGRHAVIIDVGPAYCYDLLRYLRHEGLFVDAVMLSHLDEDHAGALATLLNSEIAVPSIVMAEGAADDCASEVVADALASAAEKGAAVRTVEAGDRLSLPYLQAYVLTPEDGVTGSNERSMALDMQMAGKRILTLGDLPAECEPDALPECDILKAAHHGSRNATSADLIRRTKPAYALISVGRGNSYGHPSRRVLDDLEASGAKVYRTDESGCVTLYLDGAIRAETYLDNGS